LSSQTVEFVRFAFEIMSGDLCQLKCMFFYGLSRYLYSRLKPLVKLLQRSEPFERFLQLLLGLCHHFTCLLFCFEMPLQCLLNHGHDVGHLLGTCAINVQPTVQCLLDDIHNVDHSLNTTAIDPVPFFFATRLAGISFCFATHLPDSGKALYCDQYRNDPSGHCGDESVLFVNLL
jgi:hypothetical protein